MNSAGMRSVAAAALLVAASGCANLQQLRPPGGNVSELVNEHQYARALQILDRVQPSDPGYADARAKRESIEAKMHQYEDRQIEQARRQRARGMLADALATVNDARAKLPPSSRLKVLHAQLAEQRDHRLHELDRSMTLAHADYLLAQRRIYKASTRLQTPSYAARWRADRIKDDLKSLYKPALKCGREALKQGDMKLADRCLRTARRIHDTPEVREALAKWQQAQERARSEARARLEHERQASQRAVLKRRQQTYEDKLNAALEHGDLQGARAALDQLRKLKGNTKEVTLLAAAVDRAIAAKVQELLGTGAQLYRKGKIAAARDTWKAALALDPDNADAKARVKRAERVLKQLQRLKAGEKKLPAGSPASSPAPAPAPAK
ncbi:MAG TPA: hypothetical protein VKA76_16560 [Gammaproteobacteria bacterium]|nr:hypothetical protein [Gammaproteobacteria bacterium]